MHATTPVFPMIPPGVTAGVDALQQKCFLDEQPQRERKEGEGMMVSKRGHMYGQIKDKR